MKNDALQMPHKDVQPDQKKMATVAGRRISRFPCFLKIFLSIQSKTMCLTVSYWLDIVSSSFNSTSGWYKPYAQAAPKAPRQPQCNPVAGAVAGTVSRGTCSLQPSFFEDQIHDVLAAWVAWTRAKLRCGNFSSKDTVI